jgi:hypothetical protein
MTPITVRSLAVAIMAYSMTASAGQTPAIPKTPVADHHQHLMSPALATAWKLPAAVTSDDVIAQLDSAGIRRAAVLSMAYAWGSDSLQRGGAEEYAQVRVENDWTAAQAGRYLDRLIAFCSVNPLKEYAIAEIDRCAATPALRAGLKLHFANSGAISVMQAMCNNCGGFSAPLMDTAWPSSRTCGPATTASAHHSRRHRQRRS